MASKRKNSLVNNINRRKRAGKSRPKSRTTVSKQSYDRMEQGWPKKKSSQKRRTSKRKSGGKRKAAKRGVATKKAAPKK